MVFRLSDQNVLPYLLKQSLVTPGTQILGPVSSLSCKNFNLRLTLSDGQSLIVKQERYDDDHETSGEFWHEWKIQALLNNFESLSSLRRLVPEILHFDEQNSILVVPFLRTYCDLADFYDDQAQFAESIAATVGKVLAQVHQLTYQQDNYRQFLAAEPSVLEDFKPSHFLSGLTRINPEVFGSFCQDGLLFFKLFQRYESLEVAIATLASQWRPCCLIHRDFKFGNILISTQPGTWQIDQPSLRLIDWERCTWGDPAYDLGMVIADYLKLWLRSLVISPIIDVATALKLAQTPLEKLQPSLMSLIRAYQRGTPDLIANDPTLITRSMQQAGLTLIRKILTRQEEQAPFNNSDICMLQIAHRLLCTPEDAISAVFGIPMTVLCDQPVKARV